MAKQLLLKDCDISLAVSPWTIPMDLATSSILSGYDGYRVYGTVVLGAAFNFNASGISYKNQRLLIFWEASVSGNTVTILNTVVPTELLTKKFVVDCLYDGVNWIVKFLVSWDETDIITTAMIENLAVTNAKIALLAVDTPQIAAEAVTNAEMAQMATVTIKGNDGAGPAVPQDLTMTELRTILTSSLTITGDIAAGPISETVATGNTTVPVTIANDAITTVKILDANVTLAKLEAKLLTEIFTIEMSAATLLHRTAYFRMPWDCTVTRIDTLVSLALVGGDCGITPRNNGGLSMGLITIPVATGVGTGVSNLAPVNNTFLAGENLQMSLAVVAGPAVTDGFVSITVTVERT